VEAANGGGRHQGKDIVHEHILLVAVSLGIVGIAKELRRDGQTSAAAALDVAREAVDEALIRLGVTFAHESDHPQQDALVLRIEPGIGPDEGFDGGGFGRAC
jgi:hypothetical protein